MIKFDADSTNVYIASCAIGGLTRLMDNFIPGNYQVIEERSSDATTGKATAIIEGLVSHAITDENGESHYMGSQMACAPLRIC